MFAVVVTIDVRPERLDEFLSGLDANAAATRAEPGNRRFDILHVAGAPHRFLLYELYVDEDAFFHGHREAAHYQAWRDLCDACVPPDGRHNTFATLREPTEGGKNV